MMPASVGMQVLEPLARALRPARSHRGTSIDLVHLLATTVANLAPDARALLVSEMNATPVPGPSHYDATSFERDHPIVRLLARFDTYARRVAMTPGDAERWVRAVVRACDADEYAALAVALGSVA